MIELDAIPVVALHPGKLEAMELPSKSHEPRPSPGGVSFLRHTSFVRGPFRLRSIAFI